MQKRELHDGWDRGLTLFIADSKGIATRDSSDKVLNAIASHYPWLIGGAADLAPSTKTRLTFEGAGDLEADSPGCRNLHFGVREHAMGAVLNGLALTKTRAFGAGFLIFSDYMKLPIRLAALMQLRSSMSLRTIRSAWVRMGQRTNQSNSSSRCAVFPGSSRCALQMLMKSSKPGASSCL